MITFFLNNLTKEQFQTRLTDATTKNSQKGLLFFVEFKGDKFKLGKKGLLTKRNSGLFTLIGLMEEETTGLRITANYQITPRILDLLTLFLLVFMYFRYSNKLVVAIWTLLFVLLGVSEFFSQNKLTQNLIKQLSNVKDI